MKPIGPHHAAQTMSSPDEILLRSLDRPERADRAWGAVGSFILGGLTFGLWPLLAWHDGHGDRVSAQNAHWSRIDQWLRRHSAAPGFPEGDLPALRPRAILGALSLMLLLAVLTSFVIQLGQYRLRNVESVKEAVLDGTYRFNAPPPRPRILPPARAQRLYMDWTVGLSLAYALHWLRVRLYAADLRRVIGHINGRLNVAGVAPLPLPVSGIGLRPMWVVGAVGFALLGAVWGVPMMLAGGLQRDCARRDGPQLRLHLADRMRTILALESRGMAVGLSGGQTCHRPGCGKRLPAEAGFCSRCGTRLVRPVHLVA